VVAVIVAVAVQLLHSSQGWGVRQVLEMDDSARAAARIASQRRLQELLELQRRGWPGEGEGERFNQGFTCTFFTIDRVAINQ